MKPIGRLPSRRLTDSDASIAKALIGAGWAQSDIASLLGCNGGRISEIASGARFSDVAPANLSDPRPRADLAEVQAAWSLRMARLLSSVLSRGGSIV